MGRRLPYWKMSPSTSSRAKFAVCWVSAAPEKTTLVRLLAGLLTPDHGRMQIFGFDVVSQPVQAGGMMNRISAANSFFKRWTPLQNLVYSARLYNLELG